MTFSQCIPDTINCIDVDKPGQICPAILAEGQVGVDYLEHITIIGPDSAMIGQSNTPLVKVSLYDIENLPPGISYTAETLDFYPNQAYCASLFGVHEEEGTYYLKISVIPYMILFDVLITLPIQTDSTSVYLDIKASSSINYDRSADFSLIQAFPNPFSSETKIGFFCKEASEVELQIFSMLGDCIHRENIQSVSGPNYFDYKADHLAPGYYLYTVRHEDKTLPGRLIKKQ